MMYDWASQPYHTLILTFIFGPYFAEQLIAHLSATGLDEATARAQAQSIWGAGLTIAGVSIAVLAPILGAIADGTGRRMPWIWIFSACYIVGATGLWIASPTDFPTYTVLAKPWDQRGNWQGLWRRLGMGLCRWRFGAHFDAGFLR